MFDFSHIIRTLGGSVAGILVLVSGCLTTVAGTGCTFNMYGEGKAGVGYSSTSEVYAFHKSAEGNKSKAGSSTELSEPVTRWLFPDKDEVEMTEPMPVEAK